MQVGGHNGAVVNRRCGGNVGPSRIVGIWLLGRAVGVMLVGDPEGLHGRTALGEGMGIEGGEKALGCASSPLPFALLVKG